MSEQVFDLVDEEDASEPATKTEENFRRNRCQVCHEFQTSVRLSNIAKKEREKYRHKCSLIPCASYKSCPTQFLRAHRNDADVKTEQEQKKKAAKDAKEREKVKKSILKHKSDGTVITF
jgi:hypothetical protein